MIQYVEYSESRMMKIDFWFKDEEEKLRTIDPDKVDNWLDGNYSIRWILWVANFSK